MINGLAPPRGIAGEAASRRLAFEPCCCWELGRSHRERRALKGVDLLPTSNAATRSMICSSSLDSTNI
jgi:hypothetical protein